MRRALVLLLGTVLIVTGCGSDNPDPQPTAVVALPSPAKATAGDDETTEPGPSGVGDPAETPEAAVDDGVPADIAADIDALRDAATPEVGSPRLGRCSRARAS